MVPGGGTGPARPWVHGHRRPAAASGPHPVPSMSGRPRARSQLVRVRDGDRDHRERGRRAPRARSGPAGPVHHDVGAVPRGAPRSPHGARPALDAPQRPRQGASARPGRGPLLRLPRDGTARRRRRHDARRPGLDRDTGGRRPGHGALHGGNGDRARGGGGRPVPDGDQAPDRAGAGVPRVAAPRRGAHGVRGRRPAPGPASPVGPVAADHAPRLCRHVRAQPDRHRGDASGDLRAPGDGGTAAPDAHARAVPRARPPRSVDDRRQQVRGHRAGRPARPRTPRGSASSPSCSESP